MAQLTEWIVSQCVNVLENNRKKLIPFPGHLNDFDFDANVNYVFQERSNELNGPETVFKH